MRTENTDIVLDTRAEQAEHNFLQAEQWRQEQGFKKLKLLLNTHRQPIIEILGIEAIAPDFCLERDWFHHTGEYLVTPTITGPQGLPINIVGVRYQNNIANRNGHIGKLLCPVGGGVRVSFVPGVIQSINGSTSSDVLTVLNLEEQLRRLKQEGSALATAMVPKITAIQFSKYLDNILYQMGREDLRKKACKIILGGGAKADIFIPRLYGMDTMQELELIYQALKSCGYEWAKMGVVGPAVDRMAGDQNTTAVFNGRPIIEGLLDGVMQALREKGATEEELSIARATVSGKGTDGLEARTDATGLGCWENLKSYAFYKGICLKGKTVFFRGCGSAAQRAIVEAHRAGMKVIGIADVNAILHYGNGFTGQDAHELFEIGVNQRGNIANWARRQQQEGRDIVIYAEPVGNDFRIKITHISETVTQYWHHYIPEIIFESAAQGTLNQKTAPHVPDDTIIVEGGNGVTTPIAAALLHKKHVDRIPGINANAGGVFVSWFEWAQDVLGVQFTTEQIENTLGQLAYNNMGATLELMHLAAQNNIELTQEEAFYALAIARGLSAKNQFIQKVHSIGDNLAI